LPFAVAIAIAESLHILVFSVWHGTLEPALNTLTVPLFLPYPPNALLPKQYYLHDD
jgi:hypothetical protein